MALIPEIELTLKNGVSGLLRSGQPTDSRRFKLLMETVLLDGTGMGASPGEIDLTEEAQVKWIKNCSENPDELFLVVEVEHKLVAEISFQVGKRKRLSHTGTIGIAVHPDWRSLGIGHALLDRTILWATENRRIEKIKLNVLANNLSAVQLYKKKGFVIEGRHKDSLKYDDGTYVDDLSMALFVSKPANEPLG